MTYQIFQPGQVDFSLAEDCLKRQKLTTDHKVSMLPYGAKGNIGYETRRLYFALAVQDDGLFSETPNLRGSAHVDVKGLLPVTRIVSFGKCNVACPYCKRDCQFIGDNGLPIIATPVNIIDLFALAEGAHHRGEIVRFSGGDPVSFPRETLAIGEYMNLRYGKKVSIAHNGSGTSWVKKLVSNLSSAAIDLKAVPEKMGAIMGVSKEMGERIFSLSLETQKVISESKDSLLDVRTPVFGDTPIEDMIRIGEHISKNNPRKTFWTWRMYKPVNGCDWIAPEKEKIFEMMQKVSSIFPNHWLGVRAKWEKGGMIYFLNGNMINQDDADKTSDSEARGSGNMNAITV